MMQKPKIGQNLNLECVSYSIPLTSIKCSEDKNLEESYRDNKNPYVLKGIDDILSWRKRNFENWNHEEHFAPRILPLDKANMIM